MRLLLVLAFVPLTMAMAPTTEANGCTPCACGVAYCEGDARYIPRVDWTLPEKVVAGIPFNVTYHMYWRIDGDGNASLPLAAQLSLSDPLHPEMGSLKVTHVAAPMPQNMTALLVWPTAGVLDVRLTANRPHSWSDGFDLEVETVPAPQNTSTPPAGPEEIPVNFAIPVAALLVAWVVWRR